MKLASVIVWFLILLVPISGFPQSPSSLVEPPVTEKQTPEAAHASKVKRQIEKRGIGVQAKVKITLQDQTEVKGYVSRIDEISFQLTDKKTGKASTIPYASVDRVRGGGMSTGAKIGIGAGIAAGILVAVVLGSLAESGE